MPNIVAVYGSPRRHGNTSTILKQAVEGAREEGADVEEIFLRDLTMSPCLEIYGCRKTGRCVIQDDFHRVSGKILGAKGLIISSPIFFYTVSSHVKILIDRCQSLWVKKYWIEGAEQGQRPPSRKGLFISVGATGGKKLFDGTLLTMRYFFDVLDMELWKTLLYRGMDHEHDIEQHPEYLEEARQAGQDLVRAVQKSV